MNIDNATSIINITNKGKMIDISIYPSSFFSFVFILSVAEYFEIFPKHNEYGLVSEFFALN